jgi:mycothiol synthase
MTHLIDEAVYILRKRGVRAFARETFHYVVFLSKKTIAGEDRLRMRKVHLGPLQEVAVPQGYRLRTFQKGDEEPWAEIMNSVFGREYKLWKPKIKELAGSKEFDAKSIFFVEYEGHPVGTACALRSLHEGKEAGFVHMVGVFAEHRRKGLGRLLVLCVLRYFQEKGYTDVYLDTQDHRVPAVALYRSLGFKPITEC